MVAWQKDDSWIGIDAPMDYKRDVFVNLQFVLEF